MSNKQPHFLRFADRLTGAQFLCIIVLYLLFGTAAHAANSHYMVTSRELETRVADALVTQGAGESVTATLTGKYSEKLHESTRPIHVELHALDYDARQMTWYGEVRFYDGDTLANSLPIEGRYENLIAIPVLNKRLHRTDIIEDGDIAWEHVAEHRLRKDTILSAEELLGFSPRRVISENRAIRNGEVEQPKIVQKGDLMQIRFITANMEIRTIGQAMDDGAKGDMIRIRNSESDIVVHATIMQGGMAEVKPLMQLSQN